MRPLPIKEGDKKGSLRGPAPSHPEPKDDEATASDAVELEVRLPAFATWVLVCSILRASIPGHRPDEGGVNGELWQTSPMRRASWNIVDRHVYVAMARARLGGRSMRKLRRSRTPKCEPGVATSSAWDDSREGSGRMLPSLSAVQLPKQ